MNFGDLNFLIFIYFLIFFSFVINGNHTLYLLLAAELLWVTLYGMALLLAFINDDLNILSLTLFFLVFSAVELAVGFVLLMLQNTVLRSLTLVDGSNNFFFFLERLQSRLFTSRFNWSKVY